MFFLINEISHHFDIRTLLTDEFASCPSVTQLESIETINLYNENVINLLPHLHKFKNLKSLTLAWCNVPNLPLNIGDLKSLEELNLFGTQISDLPMSFFDLVNLKSLNISNTNISQIPSDINKLVNLQNLNMGILQLVNINSDLNNLTTLSNLHTLNLESLNLNEIPAQIFGQFTNLKFLDLNDNKINHIPITITNLKNLEKLILTNNLLSALPLYFIYMQPITILYDIDVLVHPAIYRWLHGISSFFLLSQREKVIALNFSNKYIQHYTYSGILQTKNLFQDFGLKLTWDEFVICKNKCNNTDIHSILLLTFEEISELLLTYKKENNKDLSKFKKKMLYDCKVHEFDDKNLQYGLSHDNLYLSCEFYKKNN